MNSFLSFLPVLWLLIALAVLKMKALHAAFSAMLLASGLALAFFTSDTFTATTIPSSVFFGCKLAVYPICLVILAALFTYAIVLESGAMATIKSGLVGVADGDRRVLAILIVWGFGNFMEGMAGFGTAVAIPAAILVGVGFDPVKSVLMCLVANTTPTAFGSVGVPLLTLAKVSGSDVTRLTWYAAWMQLAVTAAGPFLVLLVLDGRKALKGMIGFVFAVDAAFLVPWVLSARYVGLELPDILGGLSVMVFVIVRAVRAGRAFDLREQVRAWIPFGFVVAILAIAAVLPPSLKRYTSPGPLILVAAFAGGICQHLDSARLAKLLGKTFWNYRAAFGTICCVLAMSRVMGDAGMVASIANALVATTGSAYPLVAPVVGALGGFVTGSGTSANVLFGEMQANVATQIGIVPEILAAANVMGAGIGKMICPQSVAIGAAATALVGRESEIMKKTLVWFPAVLIVACLVTYVASVLH